MPKKIEEKNTKGSKKTTKQSTSKKVNGTKNNKQLNSNTEKKVIEIKKVPETKLEIKDVYVEKNKKKGKEKESLFNNTPFVISSCLVLLLGAIIVLLLCVKRVPVNSNGEEIIAKINGKEITANELYLSLKEDNGENKLISIIDEYISEKEAVVTEDDKKYVQEVVDYYVESAEYYKTDLETFLKNYVGINDISTEEEFFDFVLKDYKKTLTIQKYISEEAKEDELKDFYKENYSDTLTVKHILIEVDSDNEDKDAADKEAYDKAVKLIKKLKDVKKDKLEKEFEELAEKNSDDSATYSNGGLVENFTKKDVVEGFFEASEKLKDGEYTTEPVKTSYGYHIILKISSTPLKEYKDMKEQVKKDYADKKLTDDSTLFATKWDELRKEYKMEIIDDLIKKSYESTIKSSKK